MLGGSWWAALSLLIIPFQVRVLGVEAYGLLAFVASIQIIFSIFDLGLSPAVTRAVTVNGSAGQQNSGHLVSSLSVAYWAIGVCLGLALVLASDWLSAHWLNLRGVSAQTGATALKLAGFAIALRWPVSFYAAVLAGKQRFDLLNAVKAGVATVAVGGGIIVILWRHDLIAYLSWMALAAAVEVVGYLVMTWRILPGTVQFDLRRLPDLTSTVRFAAGINAINIFSMVLTQSDRLLMSKILSVQTLGYYALAYNIVFGLTLIQNFVTSAMFPAFVSSHASGDRDRLRSSYLRASQALMYVYNLPIWLLVFFGFDALNLIASRSIARQSAPVLTILALGFLCNAAAVLAYTASIGAGRTRLPAVVNVVAVFFYIPLLTALTFRWGGVGAAFAWLVLNAYYLPTLVRRVHRDLLATGTEAWLRSAILPFVVLGLACFGSAKVGLTLVGSPGFPLSGLLVVVAVIAYSFIGYRLLQPSLKSELVASLSEARLALFPQSGGPA